MQTHLYVDSHASVPLVRVVGDVDFAVKDAFRETLSSLATTVPSVAIDLSGCAYLDSSALSVLAVFARDRRSQSLMIVAPGAHAKRLLAIAGFDQIYTIVDRLLDDDLELTA